MKKIFKAHTCVDGSHQITVRVGHDNLRVAETFCDEDGILARRIAELLNLDTPPKTQSARFHRLFDTLAGALAGYVQSEVECLMSCHMLAGLCLSAAMNATGQDREKALALVSKAVNAQRHGQ